MNAEEIRQNIPIFEVAERLGITGNLRAAGDNEMRGACPLHGGDNRDAFSMYQDSNRWECRTHCGKGSQIDLVMKAQGFDAAGAIRWIKEAFHLEAGNGSHPQAAPRPQPKPARIEQSEPKPIDPAAVQFWADYAARMHDMIREPKGAAGLDYFRGRGISQEIINRFRLGYDPKLQRAIIPGDNGFPVRRAISEQNIPKYLNPSSKEGPGISPDLFNSAALYQAEKPVFIVEGAINALSVIQAGGQAVALNSASNVPVLGARIAQARPTAEIIVWLDDDEPGLKAAQDVSEILKAHGIKHVVYGGKAK